MLSALEPGVALVGDRTGMARNWAGSALGRTTLAWVRTRLTMSSFGFGIAAFSRTAVERSPSADSLRLHRDTIQMGTALIPPGIVAMALAGLSHQAALRSPRRGEPPVLGAWHLSLAVVLLSAP